ncbi:MAG: chorismate-binding protein [Candidatus Adiutrix sp.]|jgi:isochorismate synthase|nr:chorismate-binding protein [Candidatus Adiutrix sp.]
MINDPPTYAARRLDNHLAGLLQSAGFALFRPPAGPITLIRQDRGQLATFSRAQDLIAPEGGFVMAPFDPGPQQPLVLIRPDLVLRGADSFSFLAQEPPLTPTHEPPGPAPLAAPPGDFESYRQAYQRFAQAVRQREEGLRKLVLSRALTRELPADLSLGSLFFRACALFPESLVYLCSTPISGLWIGCTPEPLLTGLGPEWRTVALAGTRLAAGPDWDDKNILEQRIVADFLSEQLRRAGAAFDRHGPVTVRAGHLLHLRTDFHFTSALGPGPLLSLLHPSPAICGYPKAPALQFIHRHEGYNRGYYAGFLGYLPGPGVDPGPTDIYVNLRCLRLEGRRATLYSGGGILPDSSLEAEWQETENKLGTMLALLETNEGHPKCQ